jgi:2-polyprenyl-3-methyl-5-hydroxy-6-metoxy-1,4-benzoquinol methylase
MSRSAYWDQRFSSYGGSRGAYKAICSYGMPYLYNKYIDLLQRKAFCAALDRLGVAGRQVLDVGCGVGRWCRLLSDRGAAVTGADISEHAVALARARTAGSGMRFVVSPVSRLDLPPASFDLITCVTVLQHIVDEDELSSSLAALRRLLKPGGRLLLLEVVPRLGPGRDPSTAVLRVRSEGEYVERLARLGLSLLDVLSVDPVAAIQRRVVPRAKGVPRPLLHLIVGLLAGLTLPVEYLLAGTRRWAGRSWHKVLLFEAAGAPP